MSGGFTPKLKTTTDNVNPQASFLASEHYMWKRGGITLDATTVGADADGNKILEAGTLVGKLDSNGKYAAYANGNSDGSQTAVGIIGESVNLKDGDVICGLLLHGSVIEARTSGADATGKTDLAGRIIFQ